MSRFPHRRWIVLWVLVCQVLATVMVHVPTAHAMSPHGNAATATHCSGHSPATSGSSDRASGGNHSGAPHSCECGLCKCPCSHGTSAAADRPVPTPSMSPLAIAAPYRTPKVPDLTFAFFRPPIEFLQAA